jgi:hypothetical protein
MTVQSVKYAVEVVAGLVPGQPLKEFTRTFVVTSGDWEAAGHHVETVQDQWDEANVYARSLVDPRVVNWVQLSWVWF